MELTDLKLKELINNKETFVVDFFGEWCAPCKSISPIIDKLSKKYQDELLIGKMDVDDNPESVSMFNIRGVPCVMFFKDGKVSSTIIGSSQESKYEEEIKKILYE